MYERMIANVPIANNVQSAVSVVSDALMARLDRSVRERVLITVAQVVNLRAQIRDLRYTAIPTPVVRRVTRHTNTRAIALTTKVTRKRIRPSSTKELK